MRVTLHYSFGNNPEKTMSFSDPKIILGRSAEMPVHLDLNPDLRVSRLHAQLSYELGTWWIEDLNSQNGTFRNSIRLHQKEQLFPNDRLQLGDTTVTVDFHSTDLNPGCDSLRIQFPIDEAQTYRTISEDKLLEIFRNISQIQAWQHGHPMLESFLRELVLAIPEAEHWSIALIDDDQIVPRVSHPRSGAMISFTLARRAVMRKEAFHWVRQIDLEGGNSEIPSLYDVTSALYAPILCSGNVVGVVQVDTTNAGVNFSKQELELLSTMANIMGPAIQANKDQNFQRIHSVFLSYAPEDRSVADRLAADLRRRSIKVWFDERIKPGDNRVRIIHGAINNTDAFLLIVSPSIITSPNISKELSQALEKRKTIIPLIIYDGCELPTAIQDIQPLVITKEIYDQNINQLANAIRTLPLVKPQKDCAPIKILFLSSNPLGTKMLHFENEIKTIDRNLRMAEFRQRFIFQHHWATQPSELSEILLRYKPHIVHFSGHGNHQGGIILQDQNGAIQPVTEHNLQKLFHILKDDIRCVILSACWSTKQARAIAEEIDCVVGNSRLLSDDAAINFASGFYRGLGYGQSVKVAFDLGCLEIDLTNLSIENKPELITRTGIDASNIIFVEGV